MVDAVTPYERLRWEAERLGEGVHRIVCPWCSGGSTGEASLSLGVSASGSLYFRCFRSSCGVAGGKRDQVTTRRKEPRYYTGETEILSPKRMGWFHERFGFVPPDTRYAPHHDRYVYAMRGPEYKLRGYLARSFSGDEPKVLTYVEKPDEPFIGWALSPTFGSGTSPIVVVEDWVSSEKVSMAGAIGVCLSGTYLSPDAALELAERAFDRRVIFALDNDAFAKGVAMAGKYRGLLRQPPRVWRLKEDLKYVPFNVIERAISNDDCNDFGDEWARTENPESLH